MHAYSKWTTVLLLAAGLAVGTAASHAAETGHTDSGHTDKSDRSHVVL